MTTADWRCDVCGAANGDDVSVCGTCASPRPPATSPPPVPEEPPLEGVAPRIRHDFGDAPVTSEPSEPEGPAEPSRETYETVFPGEDGGHAVEPSVPTPTGYEPPLAEPTDEPFEQVGPGLPTMTRIEDFQTPADEPTLPLPASRSAPWFDRRTMVILGAVGGVVLLIITIAVLTTGGGGKKALSPSETVGTLLPTTTARPGPDIPTENIAAVAMLPTTADLGETWAQVFLRAGADAFQLGPNPSAEACTLPVPTVPEAGSAVELKDYHAGATVAAQVKVFATETPASADVKVPPLDATAAACIKQALNAAVAKAGGDPSIVSYDTSFEQLPAPALGAEASASRVTITQTIPSLGRSDTVAIDAISWRTGRTVAQLRVSAGAAPASDLLLAKVRDLFASRFVAQ